MNVVTFILIGMAAMLIPLCLQSIWYRFPIWKTLILTVVLTLVGTAGTKLMCFVESGSFESISFYGAVFFTPIAFHFLCKYTKQPKDIVLDLCAPAECMMLVVMKVQCLTHGCCAGRVLSADALGVVTRFPSQIAEMSNAAVLCVVLLVLSTQKKLRGTIFSWYMILYGCTRFVLNYFRENQSHFLCGLPGGAFWSVCSVAVGIYLLRRHYKMADATPDLVK